MNQSQIDSIPIQSLLDPANDYAAIRLAAARILHHGCGCAHCFWREGKRCYHGTPQRDNSGYSLKMCPESRICDIPPIPDTRPMPVIVEELVTKCVKDDTAYLALCREVDRQMALSADTVRLTWWLMVTPTEQAACCIVALRPE